MDSNDLPIFNVPESNFGPTKRHRQQNILIGCQGKTYTWGWILFGKDGSLYIHQSGQSPVTEIGIAVEEEGRLVTKQATDISSLPLDSRVGTHLSLHAETGQVHIKSGSGHKLCVGSIGPWLPVQQTFSFAHIFTAPIVSLQEADINERAMRMDIFADNTRSALLDIIVAPLIQQNGKLVVPIQQSNIFVGFSPQYAVLINAVSLPPCCEPRIYFLDQPPTD